MLLTQLQNIAWQKSYVGTWYGFFIQISIWSPQEAGSRHSSSRPWSLSGCWKGIVGILNLFQNRSALYSGWNTSSLRIFPPQTSWNSFKSIETQPYESDAFLDPSMHFHVYESILFVLVKIPMFPQNFSDSEKYFRSSFRQGSNFRSPGPLSGSRNRHLKRMHFWIPRCISTYTNPFCSFWPRSRSFRQPLVTLKSVFDPVFAEDQTLKVLIHRRTAENGTWNGCISGSLDALLRIHFVRSGHDPDVSAKL